MDNEKIFIYETEKFQQTVRDTTKVSAEKWLNIAYKFDYVSLCQKEEIDLLLKKYDGLIRRNTDSAVSAEDIHAMQEIAEIAANTRFTEAMLNYL